MAIFLTCVLLNENSEIVQYFINQLSVPTSLRKAPLNCVAECEYTRHTYLYV